MKSTDTQTWVNIGLGVLGVCGVIYAAFLTGKLSTQELQISHQYDKQLLQFETISQSGEVIVRLIRESMRCPDDAFDNVDSGADSGECQKEYVKDEEKLYTAIDVIKLLAKNYRLEDRLLERVIENQVDSAVSAYKNNDRKLVEYHLLFLKDYIIQRIYLP